MATTFPTVTIPVSFSRQPKTRKPTPPPSIPREKPSSNSNFKVHTRYKPPQRPISSTPGGGDATTYTRLPPRDDSSPSTVSEVKLSDSIVAKFSGLVSEENSEGEVEDGVGSELGINDTVGAVYGEKSGSSEDGNDEDGELGCDYGVGHVFEGSIGSSKEKDDEGGDLRFSYRFGEVLEGNRGFLKVEEEEEEEEEDENEDEDGKLGFGYRVGEVFAGKLGLMEVEEDEDDGKLGLSHRVGDVFEGKLGSLEEEEEGDRGFVYEFSDDDEGEEEEEEEEEEEGEEGKEEERDLKFGCGKIVRGYDNEGNRVTAKLYTVGDEDDNEFGRDTLWFDDGELGKFEGGLEKEQWQLKEKGLPAVMRCFDQAKIYVKAGDGGNGVVAFRREKFVPLGGPSGGDGGRGGNVYVEVDGSMNSLLPFRKSIHFRAGRGGHGQGRKMAGAKGEDVVVKVAPGTVIREAGKEELLLELLYPGQKALLLPGGRGGRGNASFKTGTNKVPKIAENGEEGPEMWLELELKLVADVGIVGAPNAGKSTLLSVISAAQPNIANYPFTTLLPNLGVVSFDYDATMVVADFPGLLEGAHQGFGLGHEFLRHTERCYALVHVVDGSSEQPEYEFEAVRLELVMFSPELAEKPYIVAFNKMDLTEAYDKWPLFKERLEARGIQVLPMSAMRRDGTNQVISTAYGLLQKTKAAKHYLEGWEDPVNLNHVADKVNKQRRASISEFEITRDSNSSTWHVVGSGLQRFVQMTNWRYLDSERRFQHVLEACGVNKSLMKLGVKEGDTVIVGEMEMVWHDSIESASLSGAKKGSTDSVKWQQWK